MLQPVDGFINASNQERRCVSTWRPSYNLPVFSLDGVILVDALPPLPSTLNDQEKQPGGDSSMLLNCSFRLLQEVWADGDIVCLYFLQIGAQLDKTKAAISLNKQII